MNAATANPEIDIANGKEAREFLAQSVGFENELIGQSNSPNSHRREARFAHDQFLPTGRFPRRLGNPVPDVPPPAGICRQRPGLRKVESWPYAAAKCPAPDRPLVELPGTRLLVRRSSPASAGPHRKARINGVWTLSSVFIEYLSLGEDDPTFGIEDFSCGF
ncbi:hypothetical protein [Bradyrhizobium sp.]|uniref:hypothetical protein n=1 Tax=Bradyrhizobium sp. TaxID=376 RepID=UPI0027337783|nr:hypothetical protein [Bradyrhizobium sp.]MDP3078760.1 hypothetical protein [Bradyrhizobium sp.]